MAYAVLSRALSIVYLSIVLVLGQETVQDAARIARDLLTKNNIGTMGTVFPADHSLAGQPFALQEFHASCLHNGSLTLITFPISQHTINIRDSPKHSASIGVFSNPPGANSPRVSLIGNVTIYSHAVDMPGLQDIRECYVHNHPEARWWLPDETDIVSHWARFDPETVYFVGGFGGAHYIGYIPLEVYQDAESASYSSLLVQAQG
ncbi:pyridoxamine 5'-phosphate oxidase-domain-containing protein [Schizophyllum amplum]|uniref:Pyridoxamine 5'-phosphate oxidase-domain-containing protein n=1 Tax=Schizophyllum amplum TaxID=97359 RepID=A0A550CXD1_9AGAR|nr:pyridoxamine 5'-phosphate oxidase-domain-containing protein [Auriculariopsis ampla]